VIAEDSEDPAYLAHAQGAAARARNMSELARHTGLTRKVLRKALAPDGNPSYATVAKALGFRLTLAPVDKVSREARDLTQ
jgi:probable addiction module antidote protein